MKEGGFDNKIPKRGGGKESIPTPANDNSSEHLPPKNLKEWMIELWLTAEKELATRQKHGARFDQDHLNMWDYHASNLMDSELAAEIEDLSRTTSRKTDPPCKIDPSHCMALLKEYARRQNRNKAA